LLSDYGIIEGQVEGSNIAIAGAWDMPSRIGKIYHDWADDNGIEPYLRGDEMFFGGRNITFAGFILVNSKEEALQRVYSFLDDIDAFNGLVPFEGELGAWNVYVSTEIKVDFDYDNNVGIVNFTFREPIVDLSGMVPPVSDPFTTGIDNISFPDLGVCTLSFEGDLNRPQPKQQVYTSYDKEGFQVTKRDFRTIVMKGFIKTESYESFITILKGLYALFSSPGARTLHMPDNTVREFFLKDGFRVSNVEILEDEVFALIEIPMSEIRMLENWNKLTDSTGLMLVDKYGRPLTEILKDF